MFHKVSYVNALPEYKLCVRFSEGVTKIYDVSPLFEKYRMFEPLKSDSELFTSVVVDQGGYGVVWNDDIDISCDELWENGAVVDTPFDGLIAMGDATLLWGLSESALRKAINYGKLIYGTDVCKFGKQWVVSKKAMEREYGRVNNSFEKFSVKEYNFTLNGIKQRAQSVMSTPYTVGDNDLREFLREFVPIVNCNKRAYLEVDVDNKSKDDILSEFGWMPMMTHAAYYKCFN